MNRFKDFKKIDDQTYECQWCDGQGEKMVGQSIKGRSITQRCPNCGGKGRVDWLEFLSGGGIKDRRNDIMRGLKDEQS